MIAKTPFFWRYRRLFDPNFPGTAVYWQNRYSAGGDSGLGSFGRLGMFKAEVVNTFVVEEQIQSVVELGCGDGAQLSLSAYPRYVGFDISPRALDICRNRFADDLSKSFFMYEPQTILDQLPRFAADLSLSLDVLYHLVEDETFVIYMHILFSLSKKHVIIYSSNHEEWKGDSHERHRNFTYFVAINFPNWKLRRKIDQRYPISRYGPANGSFADFYFFRKT